MNTMEFFSYFLSGFIYYLLFVQVFGLVWRIEATSLDCDFPKSMQ